MESTIRLEIPFRTFGQINLLRNDGEREAYIAKWLLSLLSIFPSLLSFCSLNKKRDYDW